MNYIADKKPDSVPNKSQWLGGMGAGSWFYILKDNNFFHIQRFSKEGDLECSGQFTCIPEGFDINKQFKFMYLSHCKLCTITQDDITYKLVASTS